jgi:putative ABC transport system permease protein
MPYRDELLGAWRSAKARPAVAAFVILTLALAIGTATAVWALVEEVVWRPLPVREPARLVWMWNARVERDRAPFSIPDLADYRAENRTLAGLAPFTNWTANLTGAGQAERLEGVRVAPGFFDVVGVRPAAGRLIEPGDERILRVVVLTDRLWRRRFNADASIVGREIQLSGAAYTVIGVLPRTFLFPFRDAELAVPLALEADPRRADRGANFLRVVARLNPGVAVADAQADLDRTARRLQREFPADDAKKIGVNLVPLAREIAGDARPLLLTVLGAVALLLVIASANLTNLLMVSALGRGRELAVRLALGASRAQLVRQLLMETTALVTAGGVLGIGAALWLTRLLVWWAGRSLPRLDPDRLTMSPGLVGAAALMTFVTAALCGLVPAVHASRTLAAGLRSDGRTTTGTRRQRRAADAFVAFQVAASLVLLAAVLSTVRNYVLLERVDPGFAAGSVLSLQLSLPPVRYSSPEAIGALVDRLTPRLAATAGVTDAAAISLLPLSGLLSTVDFSVVGRPEPPPDAVPQGHFRMTTPGYFRTMGIRVDAGREFEERDGANGQPVAVVSRSFARRSWPDGGAVGSQIITGLERTPRVIVGVVADVRQFSLEGPVTADLYIPLRQMPASQAQFVAARMYWVVGAHADVDLDRLASAVRETVRGLDPEVATSTIRSVDDVLAESLEARRFNMQLVTMFGQAAIGLVAIGVYGVTAFAVGVRRRELGIRVVIGATPGQIVRLVLGAGLRTVATGLILGGAAAAAATPMLSRWFAGAGQADVWSLAAAAAALMAIGALACYLPVRGWAGRPPLVLLGS